jgi:Tfp pilus assembly protein PilP
LVFVLAFILAACEGDKPQAPRVVAEKPTAKVAVQEEPREEKKAEASFTYTRTGKSDPFKPFVELAPVVALAPPPGGERVLPGSPLPGQPGVEGAAKVEGQPAGPTPPPTRPKTPPTPLQRFALKDLKLVGIITHPEGNRALVVDLDGKGYIVSEGTAMGLRNGVIKTITAGEVVVEEEEVSGGKVTEKSVVMAIGKGLEGEGK